MYHIKDEEFLRGKVPMTKEEIRFVSLGKMEMKDDDICLDIGGGTGSVSMEMARFARNGKVFVIERNDEAVELIHKNKEKLGLENITVIKGMAPDGLKDLNTKFNKIFIGGSAGNLVEIIKYSYDNKGNRVEVNVYDAQKKEAPKYTGGAQQLKKRAA